MQYERTYEGESSLKRRTRRGGPLYGAEKHFSQESDVFENIQMEITRIHRGSDTEIEQNVIEPHNAEEF